MTTVDTTDGVGAARRRWPLERALFLLAGTMTLLGTLSAAVLSPWFLLLSAFVGASQLAFVAFGDCPSSLLLRRYLGLRRGCPR